MLARQQGLYVVLPMDRVGSGSKGQLSFQEYVLPPFFVELQVFRMKIHGRKNPSRSADAVMLGGEEHTPPRGDIFDFGPVSIRI